MANLLETIELRTHDSCDWSVIWMHGLGADGSDFVPVVPELGLDPSVRIRFVFPNPWQASSPCRPTCPFPGW